MCEPMTGVRQIDARLLEAVNGVPAKPLLRAELKAMERRIRRVVAKRGTAPTNRPHS